MRITVNKFMIGENMVIEDDSTVMMRILDLKGHCLERVILEEDLDKVVKLKGLKLNKIMLKFYTINFDTKSHSHKCQYAHKLKSKKLIKLENESFHVWLNVHFDKEEDFGGFDDD